MTMVIPCMSMVVHVMGSLTWILIGQTEYDYVQIKGPWADHGLVIHVITMCRNNDLNLKNIVSCLLSGKLKTVNKSQKPYTWILCYFLSLVKALMNPQDFSSVTLAHLDEKNTHSHPFTSTAGRRSIVFS